MLHLETEIRIPIIEKLQKILVGKDKKNNSTIIVINGKKFNLKITSIPRLNLKKRKFNTICLELYTIDEKEKTITLTTEQINNLFHELRSPLFNIKSFLETLYEYSDELTSDQKLEFLEIATNETNRLNNLVKDILDFAELGKTKSSKTERIEIKRILKDILQCNSFIGINKNLLFLTSTKNIDHIVINNSDYLIRILSNLINNSIKFTYPQGIIYTQLKIIKCYNLQINKIELFIRISVVDTGIGITKKNAKNIFDRFYRANLKNNIVKGSGLGLPIIKEILLKEDQALNFSTLINKGSSASFNLKC